MAGFRPITDYRNYIQASLIGNPIIVQAVGNDNMDFLSNPDPTIDPESLSYTRIFPYRYLCDPNTEQSTIVTFGFSCEGSTVLSRNKMFKYTWLWFDVYCHHSLVRTSEGCLRFDVIVAEIDEMFNNKPLPGSATKLELNSYADYPAFQGLWHGSRLSYTLTDANVSMCGNDFNG